MTNLVQQACAIAQAAHAGQLDKSGKPYIGHIERVAARCRSDAAKCVAYLHDVLEDTDALPEPEMRRIFGDQITDGGLPVTKRAGEHYTTALEELSECIASPTDTEGEVIRREEAEVLAKSLNRFLQTLPARDRDVFLGRYYFLYSAKEIARRLEMRENYVRNVLSRTREKLRDHLRKEEFDL